jgi:carotenoid cleavage dioxygenase-like enzyme
VYVYNSLTQTTDVEILNALDVASGPVASIHLPINSGTTFHGTWVGNKGFQNKG